MYKRLIPTIILLTYSAFLANLLIFKINLFTIGHLKFRFSGDPGPANLMPFKTIIPYLLGKPNYFFAIINIGGNIALFVPIGFLIAFVYRNMTWQKTLLLAILSSFLVEATQAFLHVGIFDIDDIILNALGVMVGYWIFILFFKLLSLYTKSHNVH